MTQVAAFIERRLCASNHMPSYKLEAAACRSGVDHPPLPFREALFLCSS